MTELLLKNLQRGREVATAKNIASQATESRDVSAKALNATFAHRRAELLSDTSDVGVDGAIDADEIFAPHGIQQLVAAIDPSRVSGQVDEQVKLLARHEDFAPVVTHDPFVQVDPSTVAERQRRARIVIGAPTSP